MKFFVISDNSDTYIGMRMVGVQGVEVETKEEVMEELNKVSLRPDIAVVLITARLIDLARDEIYAIKLKQSRPLIVEIADRKGDGKVSDSIARYVREAVGLKI
jgi:V/A-type H+-transporting ATPase subunit F